MAGDHGLTDGRAGEGTVAGRRRPARTRVEAGGTAAADGSRIDPAQCAHVAGGPAGPGILGGRGVQQRRWEL